MKKVLFIGVTKFDFQKFPPLHLQEKFLGLSGAIRPYILARGKPFHKKIWQSDFYLLPHNLFFWPLTFFLAFYFCWTKKIDIIITQSPLIDGLIGVIIKKILKKELIVEIHGDWREGPFLSKKRRLEGLQRKFVPILARFSFKNADKIRAVAEYLLAEARKIAPNKQYFIFPTFTDLDVFLNEQDTKFDNFILFVGHLQKVKGVDYLIEAFAKIRADFPDLKLVLIGQGTEKLNPGDNIELKGRLSLEQTRAIMKDCYCLVLPSLSEGLPRVLLEAQALGKPVVASRVGGIPELIKDGKNGFLFEVGNVKELTEKLRILLNNRDLAESMGKTGHDFVARNFSNKKYIENYLEMINNPGLI